MSFFKRMAPSLFGFSLLAALVTPAAGQQMLQWAMIDRVCGVPDEVVSFGCGYHGRLVIDWDDIDPACAIDGAAVEPIEIYPQPRRFQAVPTQTQPSLPGVPLSQAVTAGAADPTEPDSPPPPSVPCSGGSCFGDPGAFGNAPWIAVSDWNNWHGWTVGAAIRHLANRPVSLFDLDDDTLTQALGNEVGDAHVLAAFCSLAELIDIDGVERPRILNLSFGRKPNSGELDPSDTCDHSSISCQIRLLLDHLIRSGTVVTGSAGNHGSLLFPSGISSVLAAGSLDLAAFRFAHEVAPTWESPMAIQALTPGYGICLPYLQGPDAGELWAAPPGSSYASAVLAGWMFRGLVLGSFPEPLPGVVSPVWSSELGCFVLAHDRSPSCNPAANTLLQQMLGQDPVNCWEESFQEPSLAIYGPVDPLPGGLTLPSVEEWVATTHNPAPEFDICVPCVSGGSSDLAALTVPGGFQTTSGRAQQSPVGGDLVLDVSASGGTEGDEVLDALYLRILDDFYPLLERSAGQGTELDALTGGTVRRLLLRRFDRLFPSPATQASLIYVIRPSTGTTSQYWTSTPILNVPVGRNLAGGS